MKSTLKPAVRYLRGNHSNLFYSLERVARWGDGLKRLRYPVFDTEMTLLEFAGRTGWEADLRASGQVVERAPSIGVSEDMETLGRSWKSMTSEDSNSPMCLGQLRSVVRYPVEPVYRVEIPEAHVAPDGDIIVNLDENPVRVRNFSERPHIQGIEEATVIDGPVVSLLAPYNTNYSHWILDSLLRVAQLSPGERTSLRFLLPTRRRGFIDRYLDLFEISEEQRIYVNGWTFCDRLIQIETTHRSNMPHPEAVRRFREFFNLSEKPGTRRIFIGRRQRKLENEERVYELAASVGFERHFLEDLTLEEQIKLFQQASIVTGYHGAGFANMIFSPPGAKILEIINPAKWDHAYVRLANILRQPHWHVFTQYRPHHWDASVDEAKWSKILDLVTNSNGGTDKVY
jgi:hypothetical protein